MTQLPLFAAPAEAPASSLRFAVLGSGSSGNATLVQARVDGECFGLLIDCGLGIRQLKTRLKAVGVCLDDIHAVFITHEHNDHMGGLAALLHVHSVPVWCSGGTWQALLAMARQKPALEPIAGARHWQVQAEEQVELWKGFTIQPFAVPHDAAEPLHLRLYLRQPQGDRRMGYLTDLGHPAEHVKTALQRLHALVLESNHHVPLLDASNYPPFLKRRVAGHLGHLSNEQSADLLRSVWHAGLHTVVAAHLSQQNNTPDLALAALLPAIQAPTALRCAPAHQAMDWVAV